MEEVIQRLSWRWTVITFGAMILSSLAFAVYALFLVRGEILPLVTSRAEITANEAERDIARALAAGLLPGQLAGLDGFAEALAAREPTVASVRIAPMDRLDAALAPRSAGEAVRFVAPAGADTGVGIVVRPARSAVMEYVVSASFDLLLLMLAALVIAKRVALVTIRLRLVRPLELTARVIRTRASGDLSVPRLFGTWSPQMDRFLDRLDARKTAIAIRLEMLSEAAGSGARLAAFGRRHGLGRRLRLARPTGLDVHVPLFILLFAEALTLPILPLRAVDVLSGASPMPSWVAGALPVAVAAAGLLISMVGFHLAPGKVRVRRQVVVAALIFAGGQALGAVVDSSGGLVLARFAAGFGIGTALDAMDRYAVVAESDTARRNRSLSEMTVIGIGAEVSGVGIGALIAEYLGVPAVFAVSAGTGALALLAIMPMMRSTALDGRGTAHAPDLRVVARPEVARVILGLIVPTTLMTGGIWFFALPLLLSEAGFTPAQIGRTLVLFPVGYLVSIAWLRRALPHLGDAFVTGGGALALGGLAIVCIARSDETALLVAASAVLAASLCCLQARLTSTTLQAAASGPDPARPEDILQARRLIETLCLLCAPILINCVSRLSPNGSEAIGGIAAAAGLVYVATGLQHRELRRNNV